MRQISLQKKMMIHPLNPNTVVHNYDYIPITCSTLWHRRYCGTDNSIRLIKNQQAAKPLASKDSGSKDEPKADNGFLGFEGKALWDVMSGKLPEGQRGRS